MQDPHTGASACISLACEMTLYGAALYFLLEERQILFLGIGFFLSRTLSAFALLTMKNARGEGLAYTFVSGSSRRIVLAGFYPFGCFWGWKRHFTCMGSMAFSVWRPVSWYSFIMKYLHTGSLEVSPEIWQDGLLWYTNWCSHG